MHEDPTVEGPKAATPEEWSKRILYLCDDPLLCDEGCVVGGARARCGCGAQARAEVTPAVVHGIMQPHLHYDSCRRESEVAQGSEGRHRQTKEVKAFKVRKEDCVWLFRGEVD